MKKITLLLLFIFASLTTSNAQVTYSGNNEYGRLKNFVYDTSIPNRIYATTLTKHIMVSNDNGISWNLFYSTSDAFLDPEIKQMKITNNGEAISFIEYHSYASTLNKLIVLDISTKAIVKQYSVPNIQNSQNFEKYDIYDDGTSNIVCLYVSDFTSDKVYYTSNGGQNWTNVYDAANDDSVLINNIAIDPNNTQKIVIARNGGPGNVDGGLLISEDAGQSWTVTLDGLVLESIAINPSNSNEIYVGTGVLWAFPSQNQALYHSLDGGVTWTEVSQIVWSQGGLDNVPFIAFNPNDANHVVVLGDDQIAVTLDAGLNWTTTQHLGAEAGDAYFFGDGVAFNPSNSNQVFISNAHYGYKSNDGGISLLKVDNPFYEVMGQTAIMNDGTDKILIYGVQYGYTTRNFTTQTETPIDILPLNEAPMDNKIYKIFADDSYPGRIYSMRNSFMGNTIAVSDDYGVTQNTIYTTFDTGFTAVDTDPSNSNIAWIAMFNGANATLIKIDFTNVFDPQTSFITLPDNSDFIYGLKINHANADEILVTVGEKLFKSIDAGLNWTTITTGLNDLTLPNIALSLVQNPLDLNQYTMAASNGIYTSLDSGATWTKIYNELIHKVEHSTETNGHIIGIGYNVLDILPRVVTSANGGTDWAVKTSPDYFNSIIKSGAIKFNATTAEVYLGTSSLGLLKDQIDFDLLSNTDFISNEDLVRVYPNPTQGEITIAFTSNDTIGTVATIYSITGQQLAQFKQTNKIDISNFEKGIYFLKVESTNGLTSFKEIIKE